LQLSQDVKEITKELEDMPEMKVQVDAVDVLRELATNFTEPLELIREAISNSYDAGANNISIHIGSKAWKGNSRYFVTIRDDGAGMVLDGESRVRPETGCIADFFKLGGSPRRESEAHVDWIGEKGIGIKVSFHSERIEIRTWAGGTSPAYFAWSDDPWAKIHDGEAPTYDYRELERSEFPPEGGTFTELTVIGFFDNDASHFRYEQVEDYIRWFTKWGSFEERIEKHLQEKEPSELPLHLVSLRPAPTGVLTLEAPGSVGPHEIKYGHPFPDETRIQPNKRVNFQSLQGQDYEDQIEQLNKWKDEHWFYQVRYGQLAAVPHVTWQAIVSVEGQAAKRTYNSCLRERQTAGRFSYKAADRYGLWFCKDFFCAEKANEVATNALSKEGQLSRFKILFNSQGFKLNSDRTSVGNTEAQILNALKEVAEGLVEEMTSEPDWDWTDLIEKETKAYTSERQDEKQLNERCVTGKSKPVIVLPDDTVLARVPANEAETVLLLEKLRALDPRKFAFYDPLDWRTDTGIDCVVDVHTPGQECRFIEFKKSLRGAKFNHTFRYLQYIVCWDVGASEDAEVEDSARETMRLKRHEPEAYELPDRAPWTLEGGQHVIKVFALKDVVLEKLNAAVKTPTSVEKR
jgi:hypothetical protein